MKRPENMEVYRWIDYANQLESRVAELEATAKEIVSEYERGATPHVQIDHIKHLTASEGSDEPQS